MTEQEKKLEQMYETISQIEKEIITNSKAMRDLSRRLGTLQCEWRIYEDKYIEYLRKRDCFRNTLWWLFCKITFRSTKLTKKELNKRVAKKMARVFYKGTER